MSSTPSSMSRAARVRTVTSESPRSAAMSRKEARPLRSALIIARLVSSSLVFMTFRWVGDLRKPGYTPRTSTLFARTFLSKKDSPFHFFIQQKFLLSLLLTIFFTDNPYIRHQNFSQNLYSDRKKTQDNPLPSFGASPVWAAAPRRKPPFRPDAS